MTVSSTLFRLLLLFSFVVCCSFSAVPVEQTSAPPLENKRQLRQQKRQHKKLLRLQRRQHQRNKLQRPPKNHAKLNTIGFILALAVPTIVLLCTFFALIVSSGLGFVSLNIIFVGVVIAGVVAIASLIFCIAGLVGSKGVEGSKKGLGIAGLIISGIPIAVATILLFASLINLLVFLL